MQVSLTKLARKAGNYTKTNYELLAQVCFKGKGIVAAESAKNIGVWFDNTLSKNKQVNSLCKSAFYHLRNLDTIRRFLSHNHCETLIHAFVTSRIDYCNSLLSGLPQQLLQHVQNAAARLLTYTKKHDHISPILAAS